MRCVVSNTGPLLHLGEAEALSLLSQVGKLYIPKAVDDEIAHHNSLWRNQKPDWVHVSALTTSYEAESLAWRKAGLLDFGEAEAVALARQMNSNWFLTDDAAARLYAQSLGIEVHGSLGVVLWAAAIGYLNRDDAESTLSLLRKSSLWVSAKVFAEAKVALNQLCQ